jgi:hypothetical protein
LWFIQQPPGSAQSQGHLIHPSHITLPVMEASLANQGFHVLVGRDVLEHCLFSYDGKNRRMSLSY